MSKLKFKDEDLIQSYIDGDISPEDKLIVENRIKTDPEFCLEFNLTKDIIEVLPSAIKMAKVKDILDEAHEEYKLKNKIL